MMRHYMDSAGTWISHLNTLQLALALRHINFWHGPSIIDSNNAPSFYRFFDRYA